MTENLVKTSLHTNSFTRCMRRGALYHWIAHEDDSTSPICGVIQTHLSASLNVRCSKTELPFPVTPLFILLCPRAIVMTQQQVGQNQSKIRASSHISFGCEAPFEHERFPIASIIIFKKLLCLPTEGNNCNTPRASKYYENFVRYHSYRIHDIYDLTTSI